MIVVDHITKRYGEKVAVDDLTFTVKPGIVTGFLGPNGAGKSTTMRMNLTLVLMLVASFISFFVTQAIVTSHHQQHALGDPHALRTVIGGALFLTVLGILATSIGALVRNTAGGIAFFVFLLFVLPGITAILPAATSDAINPYLPLTAGTAIATSTFENSHHLAPWTGFAVFCGYTAVALLAAAIGLLRRDA